MPKEGPALPIQIDHYPFAQDPRRGIAVGDPLYRFEAGRIGRRPVSHDRAEIDAMNPEPRIQPLPLLVEQAEEFIEEDEQ